MEKKGLQDLPPAGYDNLNYDIESEKLPSAPSDGENPEFDGKTELLEAPTAPPYVPCDVPRTLTYNPPLLVYEDIYDACIHYVTEHCCYGSKFVKQMTLKEIKNDAAFHDKNIKDLENVVEKVVEFDIILQRLAGNTVNYILETFCERRESAFASVPYIGQYIDGPENGPPPPPWDISVQPPTLFQNGTIKVEIPHTAYVKPCDVCVGNCRVRCPGCHGRGGSVCYSCGGRGRNSNGACASCGGGGRRRCFQCSGTGQVKCKKCDGRGNLKCCRILIVNWVNIFEDFMSKTYNLPLKFIKTVTGSKMLSEEQQMLTPIVNAPDESINAASLSMMNRHREASVTMRILRQKHILRSVPLTKVLYEWRNKAGEFYVYGEEKDVYFQEYPQKCCCCTCL